MRPTWPFALLGLSLVFVLGLSYHELPIYAPLPRGYFVDHHLVDSIRPALDNPCRPRGPRGPSAAIDSA